MYKYFVHYSFQSNVGPGDGSCEISSEHKSLDSEEISEFRDHIMDINHFNSVVIDNIIPLPISGINNDNKTDERIHAHWDMDEDGLIKCSNCGCYADYDYEEYESRDKLRQSDSSFCPVCGAEMH